MNQSITVDDRRRKDTVGPKLVAAVSGYPHLTPLDRVDDEH